MTQTTKLVLAAFVILSVIIPTLVFVPETASAQTTEEIRVVFIDPDGNLKYINQSGGIVDTGVDTGADQSNVGQPADWDGDGDADIPYIDSGGGINFIDAAGNNVDTGIDADGVGFMGDFDGDGDMDIVYINGTSDESILYYDGTATEDTGVDTFSNVLSPGGADFDGDGDIDIAYRTSSNTVGRTDADGNSVTYPSTDTNAVGGFGDIDQDGDIDIVYQTTNNPTPAFQLHFIDSDGNINSSDTVQTGNPGGVADWDGDGDVEVATPKVPFAGTDPDQLRFWNAVDGFVENTSALSRDTGGIFVSNGAPTEVTTLELDINRWMPRDDSQPYTVTLNVTNTTTGRTTLTDVTADANVTIYNITNTTGFSEPIATVNNTTDTIKSYNQTGVVAVNATYDGNTLDNATNLTVGPRNLTNIGIMPPEQWPCSFLGCDENPKGGDNPFNIGSSMQMLWLIIFIMVGGTQLIENPWAGVGSGITTGILFWVMEFIDLGTMLTIVFAGILVGLIMARTSMGRGVTRDNEFSGVAGKEQK